MIHLAALAIALVLTGAGEPPFQDLTFDQALASARTENKVVLIDFFTTWCPPCKQMDARTWKDKSVQEWVAKNTIAIKLNAEREREIAARYSVKAYPSMVFVKPDGVERDRLVGFKEPTAFVAEADGIVRGQGLVERARERLAGHENDPALRLDLGRALVDRARFDEALVEFLWCFDEGARIPSFGGARRASLISELVRLSDSFPPAAKAFDERRTAAENALLEGKGTSDIARDFAVLNRAWNESARTSTVYEQLAADGRLNADVKAALLDEVVGGWMQDRRYALVLEAIGDTEVRLQQRIDTIEIARRQSPDERTPGQETLPVLLSLAVEKGGAYYEALVATGKLDIAARIADRLVKLQPSSTTFVALINHAMRADAPDAARALADRGYATLTDREQKLVRIAARKIPAKE